MENSDKIFNLYSDVQRVQVSQKELDQNLEMITTQQSELHELLTSLESNVEAQMKEAMLGPMDEERERR
jgi:hypothetical protein